MSSRAARLLLALTCAASLSACSSKDEPDGPPPPQPDPPTVPYDGPWTQLPENGEWVSPEALAPCTLTASSTVCDATTPFDLSSCARGSLAGLELRDAIFRAELRGEAQVNPNEVNLAPTSGGFQFDAAGQPRRVLSQLPFSTSRADGETLVMVSQQTRGNLTDRSVFVGCEAQGPREFTGCFAQCRNGQLRVQGTFRAERMTWREGESESSGLQLRSESFVERGTPVDVYVTQGHAYVVSLPNGTQRPGGLTVFDVSDPSAPVQRTSYALPNDSYWNGVWAKDNALYVASGTAGVLVFDISNPSSPAFRGANRGGATDNLVDVHTVFVEGDRLYAMSPSLRATLIFDVSEPLEPRLLTRHTYGDGSGYPHDAFAYEGRLYVNHTVNGFLVVDATAERPTLLGRYAYPRAYSHANAVGTFNGRTVAFEGGETLGAHVRVLDVTNPAGIAKVGEYKLRTVTSIHNMILRGTRLYIAHYHEGVRVLDVADPTRPTEVAYFNTFRETDRGRTDGMFEGAIGMRVPGDGHIYVVDTARGLLILDEP
ncbi:hypothetical protein HPC49_29950 [Pyxidicoccus fallax]|uniref:Lipoprotein n=1 Tax=Pyxidicoccus fallax TaxID=394095 RepID=A0A848LTP7_9BACT|nr:hypothetical protein [Pyxidicoccus fallax]NMO21325.1 hypothetical protein [Pyxidicoccus fallax]NPC82432.1 hypothetical protein [Pyxidicoccus fallax]